MTLGALLMGCGGGNASSTGSDSGAATSSSKTSVSSNVSEATSATSTPTSVSSETSETSASSEPASSETSASSESSETTSTHTHTYGGYSFDKFEHWKTCTECDERGEEGRHHFGGLSTNTGSDITYSSTCKDCNKRVEYKLKKSVYTYSAKCTKAPTFEASGLLAVEVSDGTSTSTFSYKLPSFEEDKQNKNKVYDAYLISAPGDFTNAVYRYFISSLNGPMNIVCDYLISEDNPASISKETIIGVLQDKSADFDDYYAEATYTAKKGFLNVQDFFTQTGRGVIVTGNVGGGSFSVGDDVWVYKPNSDTPLETKIGGIEINKVMYDDAFAGESVGMLLSGVDKADLERGAKVVKKGEKLECHTKVKAEIRLYTKDEGGRHTPVSQNYRPSLYFDGIDTAASLTFDSAKYGDVLMLGSSYEVNFEFVAERIIPEGTFFTMREGGRTLGTGYVYYVQPEGATELKLLSPEDFYYDDGTHYVLDFSQANPSSIFVEQGASEIVLSDWDGDSGSWLPSYARWKVLEQMVEDLEITIQVELPNGSITNAFIFSNYNEKGSITTNGGESVLTLVGCAEDSPALFDSEGKWDFDQRDVLRVICYIEIGGNVM